MVLGAYEWTEVAEGVARDLAPGEVQEAIQGFGSARFWHQLASGRVYAEFTVGDPVTSAPVEVTYPALLAESFDVVGYPLATVLAEKVVTMVDRGAATTRERDFADVFVLTRRYAVGAAELGDALRATGADRQSDLRPLRSVLITLAASRQADWGRIVNRSGLGDDVPADYAETIAVIAEFADPIISGERTSGDWDPVVRAWRP